MVGALEALKALMASPRYSPPRSFYPASPRSLSSASSELEYLAEEALHVKNAVFAEIARMRLENAMLRAEDARLAELKQTLLGVPEFSFSSRGWGQFESSMVCFRGQLNPTGSADGWGTAVHDNGDLIVGEFTAGAVNGLAVCTTSQGEVLLSQFEASRPVGVGVAWGADRSHIARLDGGRSSERLETARAARRLIDEQLGDIAFDLLSSLSPPLTLPSADEHAPILGRKKKSAAALTPSPLKPTQQASPPLPLQRAAAQVSPPSQPSPRLSLSPPQLQSASLTQTQQTPIISSPPQPNSPALPSLTVPDVRNSPPRRV